MLVTFKDINNPRSVQRVPLHDFESVFGPGVTFRGAALELTNDSVTRGIEEKLPWSKQMKSVVGGKFDITWQHPERNLGRSNFWRR